MTTAQNDKEAKKEMLKARADSLVAEEKELNKGRSGKGTRVAVGMTRGKGTTKVQWEAFDESQPDTLPTTLTEFMDISKVQDEKQIVAFLIDGFNSAMYTAASDPIAEYVELDWPEEIQRQFRLTVRNYSNSTDTSIEDAVALIKPGVVKKVAADKAAEKAAA